ncbi:MAG: bifunctional folylpolyglutamate synthase/dihydrofolate synthase [Chitinophagaceae bacterium]|nr:bifunctional folylpolyglutamate synthase/dihydrofolate synthase [Chitinophagaceae bacterium]
MNYQETIGYLYNALPMFSRIGAAAIKKDLTNIELLCKRLGDPHRKCKAIHIAGTNGKGSVSHMLASVLQSAGYTVGLYTSPHLKDFRERIRINGTMISEDFIIEFVEKVKPFIEEIAPSFFEITVALAFEYFSVGKVDIAVIETGLGGRLDSTNIIVPELCVITNIGLDHVNILGDTIEQIAFEKAGIIKEGVPAVIGESHVLTEAVFARVALQKNTKLLYADRKRYVDEYHYKDHDLTLSVVNTATNEKKTISLDLTGIYQSKNLVTVLAAIDELRWLGWKIPEEALRQGLKQVKKTTGLLGRWDVIHRQPLVVMDVAHNEDGMKQVLAQVELMNYHDLHIIIGMVKDKDVEKVLELLPPEACYYFTKAQIPRALPEHLLAQMAAQKGLAGNTYEDVNSALQSCLQSAHANDLVVICGSVFLVGEVNPGIFAIVQTHISN